MTRNSIDLAFLLLQGIRTVYERAASPHHALMQSRCVLLILKAPVKSWTQLQPNARCLKSLMAYHSFPGAFALLCPWVVGWV